MATADVLLGSALLLAVGLLLIAARRRLLSRSGGAVEMSFRLKDKPGGRGWVLGVGRFVGDELQWFKVFSPSNRPRRTLSRRDLAVESRRGPRGPETRSLLAGAEVLRLRSSAGVVEVAMDASAITGFLAWLEAQPPGATLPA